MDPSFGLIVLLVLVFAIVSLGWSYSRSEDIIQTWADQNGYTLLSSERRNILRGPFFFRSDDAQTVYYVTIKDQQGRKRRAWVRCGGWFLGLASNAIEVEWDD